MSFCAQMVTVSLGDFPKIANCCIDTLIAQATFQFLWANFAGYNLDGQKDWLLFS